MNKCPFCKNRINRYDGLHIYRCDKNTRITSKDDIKYEYIKYNFPNISQKNILFDEYVIKMKSLPDIKKDYNLNYKNILFLIDYFKIKKRSMKTSSKQISSKKCKKTILNRYGVDNISKIKTKKNNKNIIINNTDNYKYLIETLSSISFNINKYDIDNKIKDELRKIYKKSYNYWINLNDEQKYFLNDKNHHFIESRISDILDKLNISYTKRFSVGKRFFDFKIKSQLIDVNGDFWHANPNFYKENDTLSFPFKKIKAKYIWIKDDSKRKLAESKGYNIIYIWENDIKELNDNELISFLSKIIIY